MYTAHICFIHHNLQIYWLFWHSTVIFLAFYNTKYRFYLDTDIDNYKRKNVANIFKLLPICEQSICNTSAHMRSCCLLYKLGSYSHITPMLFLLPLPVGIPWCTMNNHGILLPLSIRDLMPEQALQRLWNLLCCTTISHCICIVHES